MPADQSRQQWRVHAALALVLLSASTRARAAGGGGGTLTARPRRWATHKTSAECEDLPDPCGNCTLATTTDDDDEAWNDDDSNDYAASRAPTPHTTPAPDAGAAVCLACHATN